MRKTGTWRQSLVSKRVLCIAGLFPCFCPRRNAACPRDHVSSHSSPHYRRHASPTSPPILGSNATFNRFPLLKISPLWILILAI